MSVVLLIKLTLAPGLVAATTLIGRRYGPRVAGWVGGLPVIVGPILLALALDMGSAFAAEAAGGSLHGLVSLMAFVLAYAWVARWLPWWAALLVSWAAFAAGTVALEQVEAALLPSLVAVCLTFLLTLATMPRAVGGTHEAAAPPFDLLLRAGATLLLVVVLTGLADTLGPRLSGLLAAFPVLASVLVAFTHANDGAAAAADFLRGLVTGLLSYALFCFVAAELLVDQGIAVGLLAATGVALAAHAAMLLVFGGAGRPGRLSASAARTRSRRPRPSTPRSASRPGPRAGRAARARRGAGRAR